MRGGHRSDPSTAGRRAVIGTLLRRGLPGAADHGGMAERTNARLLKSREVQASVGSNPTPSAFTVLLTTFRRTVVRTRTGTATARSRQLGACHHQFSRASRGHHSFAERRLRLRKHNHVHMAIFQWPNAPYPSRIPDSCCKPFEQTDTVFWPKGLPSRNTTRTVTDHHLAIGSRRRGPSR